MLILIGFNNQKALNRSLLIGLNDRLFYFDSFYLSLFIFSIGTNDMTRHENN